MKSTLILLALNALAVAVVVSAAGGNGVREERIQVTFVPKHKGDTSGAYTESGIAVDKVSSNVDQREASELVDKTLAHASAFLKETDAEFEALKRERAEDDLREKKEFEEADKRVEQLHSRRVEGLGRANALNNIAADVFSSMLLPDVEDEFAGGEDLFEQFFPGAIQHRRRRNDGFLASIIRGIENSVFHTGERYSGGMRHGRNPNKRWNSEDHKHKPHKQCCCRDIHKFCKHINTDGGAVGFYKVMKCLADRQRTHHDIHPLCVKRLGFTVAGSCAADIDRVCSKVLPGNNALHKCLLKHQNDGATTMKCQAYLDLVQVQNKKQKYVRPKTVAKGQLENATKGIERKKVLQETKPQEAEAATRLVLKSSNTKATPLKSKASPKAISNTAASANAPLAKHFMKPMYLIVGIAGVVVIIVGLALGVKRQRDQAAREEAIHYASLQ